MKFNAGKKPFFWLYIFNKGIALDKNTFKTKSIGNFNHLMSMNGVGINFNN